MYWESVLKSESWDLLAEVWGLINWDAELGSKGLSSWDNKIRTDNLMAIVCFTNKLKVYWEAMLESENWETIESWEQTVELRAENWELRELLNAESWMDTVLYWEAEHISENLTAKLCSVIELNWDLRLKIQSWEVRKSQKLYSVLQQRNT